MDSVVEQLRILCDILQVKPMWDTLAISFPSREVLQTLLDENTKRDEDDSDNWSIELAGTAMLAVDDIELSLIDSRALSTEPISIILAPTILIPDATKERLNLLIQLMRELEESPA